MNNKEFEKRLSELHKAERNNIFHSREFENVFNQIEEFERQLREHKEKTLAEIITKYDFIVGSKECKYRLMEILPERANVICTPYIEDPTKIYAIKKFDINELDIERREIYR